MRLSWKNALLSITPKVGARMVQKLGMVANTCNPSTQEAKARGSEAQGNLSYAV